MENKQFPSNKKLISIQEEKFIREFDYNSADRSSTCSPKNQLLLEIVQKGTNYRKPSQKVLVSIKKAPPIKTLYIAEKSHFRTKKSTEKSGSRLAIGDHSSFNSYFSKQNPYIKQSITSDLDAENCSSSSSQLKSSISSSKCSRCHTASTHDCENIDIEKKYYEYVQPYLNMNISKGDSNTEKLKINSKKVDIATLVVTNTPSKENFPTYSGAINKLQRRIDRLERKILRQEMVFRTFDQNIQVSSSDEEDKNNKMKNFSSVGPTCSYIQQYSHIPETSAFQRYSHQGSPSSPSRPTNLEKEHNSEQYGRDFTTYDGITARGKRQSASVPCKRDDVPKIAAERVHKLRHKLNPVRDYRLMDTVHYLAQGEFAPRDDGIKLTQSREAVLSDIIWEDVCRTHWPNTRLGRRAAHPERFSTRGELQRLIDNLLRERVAHVERRKRRHYRIVKLNNRHENCRAVGKTGDIIVASHKNRQGSSRDVVINEHKRASAVMSDGKHEEQSPRRSHRSCNRKVVPGVQPDRLYQEYCNPGTSYAAHSASNRESTNCYRTSAVNNHRKNSVCTSECNKMKNLTSNSSISGCKAGTRKPRLVVKKDASYRKNISKEEPNLEHFIILPTLVVRTPSNMKRQKKFNELYHRILNVHINEAHSESARAAAGVGKKKSVSGKKDIGLNINITLSDNEETT